MRAREFVNEDKEKLRKGSRYALPNARRWPDLDNSSPYHAFRFSVAMAGSPNEDMPLDGPIGQKLVTIGYTDADEEIIERTGKMLGFKSQEISTKGSEELPSADTTSPVANWQNSPQNKK